MSLSDTERSIGEISGRHALEKMHAAMGISSTDNIKVAVRVRPRSASEASITPDCVVVSEVLY